MTKEFVFREKNEIRKTLLSYDVFLDNEYLDKYIEFIMINCVNDCNVMYCNNHHMIPVAYYKIKYKIKDSKKAKKIADNDSNNKLFKLTYVNHILAHYYLCLCTKEPLLSKMSIAFFRLVNRKWLYTEFNPEKDLSEFSELYQLYINSLKSNGRPLSNETKRKLSIYWTGRKRGAWSTERKRVASARIKKSYANGERALKRKSCTDETKLKISLANKGKVRHRNLRKVICIETQEIFDSTSSAAKFLGVNQSVIVGCCRYSKYHQSHGYHFAYYDDIETINELSQYINMERYSDKRAKESWRKSMITSHKRGLIKGGLNKKRVVCITTGRVFNSISEASKYGNISVSTLCGHLTGCSKTCGKLHNGTRLVWRYYNE